MHASSDSVTWCTVDNIPVGRLCNLNESFVVVNIAMGGLVCWDLL